MDPYSRGKRILDLSLEMQRQDIEEKKLKPSYCSQSLEKEPSVLDISTSQLVNLSDEVDLCISDADMSSFNDFPSIISSSMKVANYIMHHCTDTVTDNTHIIQGNTDGFFKDKDYTELTEVVHDRNYLSETDSTESYYKNIEDQIEIVQNEPTFITDVAEVQPISVAHDERRESTTIEDSQTSANATNIEGDTVFSEKATGAAKANNKRKEEKQKRQHGESYKGRHFDKQSKQYVEVEKEEQKLGPRCSCKASYYLCKEVTDEVREKIHKEIWKMSWDEKKVFVRESVCVREVKERKVVSESYKRNNTMIFSLKGNGERKRVCKEMFLNTTGLKKWWVLNTLTDVRDDTCKPLLVQDSDGLKFIKEFIGRLPKMPSHYCRKDTSKLYLEPMFQSYSDIYHEYIKICESESKPKMSRTSFVAQIKAMNISIFQPRKDQCDTCCEFSQGNSDEALYIKHRERKEAAQNEKSKDKEAYPLNSRTKLLCVDVQRVLLAPSLKASTLYYKTKLQVHNYTIYDMVSKDVVCFVWNEAEGGLSANEFASCLVAYLEENVNSFDKVIIYSDGCTYQNRNRVLATALRYFCVKHTKSVEQKILERGHTQMEVDSVHATIERRLKNKDIYLPLDYVHLIKASRMNPRPYQVKYLTFDFFKNFEKIENGLKSLKPSKDAKVTDVCALKYESDGSLFFKLSYPEDWQTLSLGRRDKLPTSDPHTLYQSRRKIKSIKYEHLQSMKAVLPSDVHNFYDSLPHC